LPARLWKLLAIAGFVADSFAVHAQEPRDSSALHFSSDVFLMSCRKTGYAPDQTSLKRFVLCFNVSPEVFLDLIPRMGER